MGVRKIRTEWDWKNKIKQKHISLDKGEGKIWISRLGAAVAASGWGKEQGNLHLSAGMPCLKAWETVSKADSFVYSPNSTQRGERGKRCVQILTDIEYNPTWLETNTSKFQNSTKTAHLLLTNIFLRKENLMALMTSVSPKFQNSICERWVGSKNHREDIFNLC